MTTHNKCSTKEYKAWRRMKGCCYNPNVAYYSRYGGQGIVVCEEWKNDFSKFYEDMGPMPDLCNGIELIDSTKEFCKINCRWVKKNKGRHALPDTSKKTKRSNRKKRKSHTLCVSIDHDQYEFIKSQSLYKSVELGKIITVNDMIRECLNKSYPTPGQLDMFGSEIKK